MAIYIMARTYKAQDGNEYPLEEASYDFAFKAYRTDCKKSIIGDPILCVLANGMRRQKHVIEAYVGSGGDAYLILEPTPEKPYAHAVHFTIPTTAARVRDEFDKNKKIQSQIIWLKAPTAGRTIEARSKLNKKRYEEVKNGAPVKRRGKQNASRVARIGMKHRPKAKISRKTVEFNQTA